MPARTLPDPVKNDTVPLTKSFRAAWMRQDTDVPRHATRGHAWKAPAWADPNSAAYRCWLFQPDGSDRAYYCFEDDLAFADAPPPRITARELIEKLQDLTLDAHVDIEVIVEPGKGASYTIPLADVFQMASSRSRESDPHGVLIVLSPRKL